MPIVNSKKTYSLNRFDKRNTNSCSGSRIAGLVLVNLTIHRFCELTVIEGTTSSPITLLALLHQKPPSGATSSTPPSDDRLVNLPRRILAIQETLTFPNVTSRHTL